MTTRRLWWLIPLLLLVFWLGARGLNADPIWSDEYYSIYSAGLGPFGPLTPAGIWERIAGYDPWHTPGFFTLLNFWGQLVGATPPALRALSLLLALPALAWTYRLGRDVISPRAGLYAAVVGGTSTFFLYYTHEIRMYTLLALLTPYIVWVYFRVLKSPTRGAWVGFFLGALALLYTHYFGALPLMAIGIYHLLFAPKNRRWWLMVGVVAVAGMLFLPWFSNLLAGLQLAASRRESLEAASNRASIDSLQVIGGIGALFSNGGTLLLVALIGVGVWKSRGARTIALSTALLVALILIVNWRLEILEDTRLRYLLLLWPLLALLAGAGIEAARRVRYGPQAVLAGWLALATFGSTVPSYLAGLDSATYIFPIHEETHVLAAEIHPGDTVINYLPPRLPEGRYDKLMEFYFDGLTTHTTLLSVMGNRANQRARHREVLQSLAPAERLWLAYMPDDAPPLIDDLEGRIAGDFQQCRVPIDQPSLRLELYSRSTVCCAPDAAAPLVRFGDEIVLTGVETSESADALSVVLAWSLGADVPLHLYSVALHLNDSNGGKVAQADYGLEPDAAACHRASLPLGDVATGEYELSAGVYAWQTGAHLPGIAVESGEQGDMLPLATVSVTR